MTQPSQERVDAVRDMFQICVVCGKPLGTGPIVLVRDASRAAHDPCDLDHFPVEKRCPCCDKTKDRSEFWIRTLTNGTRALQSHCKVCQSSAQLRRKSREKAIKQQSKPRPHDHDMKQGIGSKRLAPVDQAMLEASKKYDAKKLEYSRCIIWNLHDPKSEIMVIAQWVYNRYRELSKIPEELRPLRPVKSTDHPRHIEAALPSEKWCPKCEHHLHRDNFRRRRTAAGSIVLASWCIPCKKLSDRGKTAKRNKVLALERRSRKKAA